MSRLSPRTSFYALFASSITSALGGRISAVAIPWLVFVTTHDPRLMGIVVIASVVPYLASSVLGAPLADRLGLRTSVIIADLISFVCTGVIAGAPHLNIYIIMAMTATQGVVRGAADRSKHVILRPIAEAAGAKMARVTAAYDGLGNGATMLGTPLGGVLVAWLGAQGAIWLDAFSFLACAILMITLVRLPAGHTLEKPAKREPYFASLVAGGKQLIRDRLLFGMLIMVFFANVANQANSAVFVPLWVNDVLHSPVALGTIMGSFATGAVIGNLVFTALAPKLPRYLTFTIGIMLSGAPRFFVMGLTHNLATVLSVTFVCGFVIAAVNPILGVMLYERVPDEFQTRVFGLVAAVSFAGYPVGGVLGGFGVTTLGLSTTIVLAGVLYVLATGIPLLRYPSMRKFITEEEHRTAQAAPDATPDAAEDSPEDSTERSPATA